MNQLIAGPKLQFILIYTVISTFSTLLTVCRQHIALLKRGNQGCRDASQQSSKTQVGSAAGQTENVAARKRYSCFISPTLSDTSVVRQERIHLSFLARTERWKSA